MIRHGTVFASYFRRKRMSLAFAIRFSSRRSLHVNLQTLPRMRPQAHRRSLLPAVRRVVLLLCLPGRGQSPAPAFKRDPGQSTETGPVRMVGLPTARQSGGSRTQGADVRILSCAACEPTVRKASLSQKRFQAVQTHRLGEVGVEAGFLGAVSILFLSISRQRHQKRVSQAEILAKVAGQLKTAHTRHTDVAYHHFGRLQPGQGQRRLAVVRGSLPRGRRIGATSPCCRPHPCCRRRPGFVASVHSRPDQGPSCAAGYPAGIFARSGRRTTNSVPWPRPALAACTQPPCNSIMLRTKASPIPNPSTRAARRTLHLGKQIEDSRQHGRFDPDARVAHAQNGLVADRLHSQFDAAPIFRILGAVVQQV